MLFRKLDKMSIRSTLLGVVSAFMANILFLGTCRLISNLIVNIFIITFLKTSKRQEIEITVSDRVVLWVININIAHSLI